MIIPIYNVAPYLGECLDSIAAQTYGNFRAIMVDDCSSDDSAKIATQYTKDERFILLQKQCNEGLGMARNTGLDYVFTSLNPQGSDYIGFVDSDDVVACDYYANLIFCLEAHKGISVAKSFNVIRFNDSDYKKSIFAYRARKSKGGITAKGSKIASWLMLCRAEFLRDLRYSNARLGEDITFGNIINALSNKVAYTRTARYFYRQREGSLMKLWRYSNDEQLRNFAYMLGEFARLKLLEANEIKTDLVENVGDEYFGRLQNIVRGYNFSEAIYKRNPNLRTIAESSDYAEFRAKLKVPFGRKIRQYFRIDIRIRRIFVKLFGKTIIDKRW
ncbi:glycosyltransferase family 2 protein [Helicobacter sp. 23-1044]